jgi:hypothetical protein
MMNMSLKLVKLLELVYLASENRTEGKQASLYYYYCAASVSEGIDSFTEI